MPRLIAMMATAIPPILEAKKKKKKRRLRKEQPLTQGTQLVGGKAGV